MTPMEAPIGVEVLLFPRPNGAVWASWLASNPKGTYWENRKVIHPRIILIHTNGGPTEAHRGAIGNYAMSAPDTTKPTYQVDRDGTASKFLPSDRQGIANYQADPFSISIETADLGWPSPGPSCGFTAAQAETVARIVAFESALWDIPIVYPSQWNGEGVACHTEPFTYPYWTKYQGKPCPGTQKKLEVVSTIMPRAVQLRFGQPPQPEDEDMTKFVAVDGTPAQCLWTLGSAPVIFASIADRDEILKGLGMWDPATDQPLPGITMSLEMFHRLGGVGV